MTRISKTVARATSVGAALVLGASAASAGGFLIQEQSAQSQGASFAGAGASTALSAMFWNSAAVTSLGGTNVDSNVTWISPEGIETARTGTTSTLLGNPNFNQSTDIGRDALVPSSYMSYQAKGYDPRMFIGIGVNSPFGLKTEPDHRWVGSQVGSASSVFTVNFNPTIGYKFSDALSVAVGGQFEYAKGIFKFATLTPTGPTTFFDGDSLAGGATAGLMYTPTPATRIGLGWRSQLTHELEGRFATGGSPLTAALTGSAAAAGFLNTQINNGVSAKAELRLPDIVTLSLNQAVAPNARVLGTVEWSNWSRLSSIDVVSTTAGFNIISIAKGSTTPSAAGTQIASLSAPWSDGWLFSGGLEYDVSPALTVRAGGAYEISPIRKPTDRLTGVPDADRIWASFGFSYNVSAATSIDFGYSHLFVDSVQLDRTSVAGAPRIVADLDASVDIVSLGVRMKLGE